MKEKSTKNSGRLFAAAQNILPGGVDSPVRAFRAVGRTPLFIRRGKGARIFDADGNAYTDYVMSWGPLVFGHAYPAAVRAVRRAAGRGLSFGAPTARETQLAEEIAFACPHCEMVRLVSSGTEAVMSAVRLARGFTGRDKIVKFAGCYHGHADGLLVRAGSGCLTGGVPDSLGVPAACAGDTLVAGYNDLQGVRRLLEEHRGQVACVVVEPVAANMGVVPPREGFLRGLRALCDEHGALLLFDEVITGFRVAYGGAAECYGVTPDLAAYGKIVGGGMPLAAYGGRLEIMRLVAPAGGVYQAGTLSGNPVATAAGLAVLSRLREGRARVYPRLEALGARLEAAFSAAGVAVSRVGSLLTPFFGCARPPQNYEEVLACDGAAFSAYFSAMLARGQYVAPSPYEAMFVSAAHTAAQVERTCRAVRESCAAALAPRA